MTTNIFSRRVKMNPEVRDINVYPTLLRVSDVEIHHQMLFYVITNVPLRWNLMII